MWVCPLFVPPILNILSWVRKLLPAVRGAGGVEGVGGGREGEGGMGSRGTFLYERKKGVFSKVILICA
jgi:hypothetical protein